MADTKEFDLFARKETQAAVGRTRRKASGTASYSRLYLQLWQRYPSQMHSRLSKPMMNRRSV